MSGGELVDASKRGDVGVVREILRVPGVDVNRVDNKTGVRGCTPLCAASIEGHWEVVRELVRVPGVDVNCMIGALTPLFFASRGGHWKVVKELLRVPGVDVNNATFYEWTPLLLASKEGHWEVVRELVRVPGIDVNRAREGGTPLLLASKEGYWEVVRELLRVPGIDVNRVDTFRGTALLYACLSEHAVIAKALVRAGADVHAKYRGKTLLEKVCRVHGGVHTCVRSARSIAGPMLNVLLLGGLPHGVALDIVVEGLDDGLHGVVAVLLSAGARVPPPPVRRSERLRQQRI